MTLVVGVDGFRHGWVSVTWDDDGSHRVEGWFSIDQLLAATQAEVVAIDIPIGLPESGSRDAELLARKRVGARHSSVFPAPLSAVLEVDTYAEASETSRAIHGKSLSKQAWSLVPKIREVRDALVSREGPLVIEVHPEVSFAAIAGQSLPLSKHSPEGLTLRSDLLRSIGLDLAPDSRPRGSTPDDLLDAGAAAWTARRVAAGLAERLPAEPRNQPSPAIWV